MRKTFYIIVAALLLTACEKQVDIDVDALEPEVVVKALGEVDSPLQVRLTYSRPTFGTFYVRDGESYFKPITDATVTLKANGAAVGTAVGDDGDYSFAYAPQPGDRLVLSIEVPGHETVSAEAEVPQLPQAGNVSASGEGQNIFNKVVHFTLTDQAGSDDYYSVRLRVHEVSYNTEYDNEGAVISRDTADYEYYADFSCTDYTVISNSDIDIEDPEAANTYWGDELLFTDANISGLSHEFRLQLRGYGYGYYDEDYYDDDYYDDGTHRWEHEVVVTCRLEVSALSRDSYFYLQSIDAYDYDDILSLFGEPVQIHSNVNGGIGIFGVKSRLTLNVPLND